MDATIDVDVVGVQEVIKELDSLSGLEIGSEQFFYAVNLFSLKEKRETFVSLKPEMKLNWLKDTHGLESSSKLSICRCCFCYVTYVF